MSIRIDAQYEIGLFLCPSVCKQHLCVKSKFIYEIVEVYFLNQYGCLFLSYIYTLRGLYYELFGDTGLRQPFLHPNGCKRTCLYSQTTRSI